MAVLQQLVRVTATVTSFTLNPDIGSFTLTATHTYTALGSYIPVYSGMISYTEQYTAQTGFDSCGFGCHFPHYETFVFNTSNGFSGQGTPVIVHSVAVPSPIAGAGLPGLMLAALGLLGWRRRQSRLNAVKATDRTIAIL